MNQKISREDLIPIAILSAGDGKIEGKTRLQKLAFLLDEEKLGDRFDAYEFRKYDYGPFSKELLEDVEDLKEKNLVEIRKSRTFGGNTRYDYRLTEMGRKVAKDLFQQEDASVVFEQAVEIFTEYGDLPLRDLIELVYEKYPEYEENSVYQY
ncbi:MAG: PadR family transcriptional regulator [Halobacteriaceae archaeon]